LGVRSYSAYKTDLPRSRPESRQRSWWDYRLRSTYEEAKIMKAISAVLALLAFSSFGMAQNSLMQFHPATKLSGKSMWPPT